LTHEKVSSTLQPMSIKSIQSSIQAHITWLKKSKKGRVKWKKNLFDCMFATTKTRHNDEDKVCIQSGNVLTSL